MQSTAMLLSYPQYNVYARQFEVGAKEAASQNGLTVVIDVFRASNTMIELMKAGAKVKPVTTIDEALSDQYDGAVRVGEDEGTKINAFDHDNSPITIQQVSAQLRDRDVIIRTTNGTRGILAALGSRNIIVGTFRNFSAVIDVCVAALHDNIPVSFVAMGTLEESRIEDDYCAKMFLIRMLLELGLHAEIGELSESGMNPWQRNWKQEIMDVRGDNEEKRDDYEFALQLDQAEIVPVYNPDTGYLEEYNSHHR